MNRDTLAWPVSFLIVVAGWGVLELSTSLETTLAPAIGAIGLFAVIIGGRVAWDKAAGLGQ